MYFAAVFHFEIYILNWLATPEFYFSAEEVAKNMSCISFTNIIRNLSSLWVKLIVDGWIGKDRNQLEMFLILCVNEVHIFDFWCRVKSNINNSMITLLKQNISWILLVRIELPGYISHFLRYYV